MTNPSLLKKSAARIAAVQCLYTRAVSADAPPPAEQVEALKRRLANNTSEQKLVIGSAHEPNYAMLQALLEGVADRTEDIDKRIELALRKSWKRERVSPVLIAILQCSIFELFFYKETKPKIVVDEYTRLTRSFFPDQEADFIHASLLALITKYNE